MRRMLLTWAAVAAVLMGLATADALTVESGYTATLLFDATDAASLTEWSDLNTVLVGDSATDATWARTCLRWTRTAPSTASWRATTTRRHDVVEGIVRSSAQGATLQSIDWREIDWIQGSDGGWISFGDIRAIALGAVYLSAGSSEERLLVARTGGLVGARTLDVLAYELEPGTDGVWDATVLFSIAVPDGSFGTHMAVDSADGTVFLLQGMPGVTNPNDGRIRAFEWSGSAYRERSSLVTSAQVGWRDLELHAGALYTHDLANRSASSRTDPMLAVDPDGTDSTSTYAYLRDSSGDVDNGYYGMASAGTALYLAEWITKKRKISGEITLVVPGATTSSGNAIATFGTDVLWDLAAPRMAPWPSASAPKSTSLRRRATRGRRETPAEVAREGQEEVVRGADPEPWVGRPTRVGRPCHAENGMCPVRMRTATTVVALSLGALLLPTAADSDESAEPRVALGQRCARRGATRRVSGSVGAREGNESCWPSSPPGVVSADGRVHLR